MDISKFLMGLSQILVFLLIAIAAGLLLKQERRSWAIFLVSLLSVYLFQPLVPLRDFGFWFPTASILLTAGTWLVVRDEDQTIEPEDMIAGGLSVLIIILVSMNRFVPLEIAWLPGSVPPLLSILVFLSIFTVLGWIVSVKYEIRRLGTWIYLFGLIGIFVVIKTEPLMLWLSELLREMIGQSTALASTLDFSWLGFSYISFRLLHTLRDRHSGRLPAVSLRDFMTYVLFFPALVAGPIDRIERFVQDLQTSAALDGEQIVAAGRRILLGLVKKFALADGLALLALSPTTAPALHSAGWAWVLLYGYSFRLFFDFSGYTDIAIGMGMLTGVKLPENFDQPYLKSNMTTFWNSWHMTLARWFRSYFFNPLTRALRSGLLRNSPGLIVLIGQFSTMLLIGLWHGITWNFALWGLWHGVGLFIHNRWVNYLRARSGSGLITRLPEAATRGLGTLVTFHFTALGWVWFALPDFEMSVNVFRTLFGMTG